jgi:hypothetical protein
MIRTVFAALLLLLAASAAHADEIQCFANDSHIVVGVLTPDRIGNHFYAGDRAQADAPVVCDPARPFTHEITVDDSEVRLEALSGHYVAFMIDAGPEHFLRILDLEQPDPVLDVDARDVWSNVDGIFYFEMTYDVATPENCPEYAAFTAEGMSAFLGQERFFNFKTGAVEAGAARSCYQVP